MGIALWKCKPLSVLKIKPNLLSKRSDILDACVVFRGFGVVNRIVKPQFIIQFRIGL